jgi:hypothetical protein
LFTADENEDQKTAAEKKIFFFKRLFYQ